MESTTDAAHPRFTAGETSQSGENPPVNTEETPPTKTEESPQIYTAESPNPPIQTEGSPPVQVKSLKVAVIQMAAGPDKRKNLFEAVTNIAKAKECGAQMVVLPECFNSPYGVEHFKKYAEPIPCGETSCALSAIACQCCLYIVGGSIPECCGDNLYNTSTVWNPNGQLIAVHRKVHLFDVDIPKQIKFKESDVLTAGNKITTFCYGDIKVGLGICYDIRFQEMSHLMTRLGTKILIYPAAFNTTTGPKHWELLARGRANDHQSWVIMASPSRDAKASYKAYGHSMVVNPWGEVVKKLDEKPGALLVDIDMDQVETVRCCIPIQKQRRKDMYDTVIMVPGGHCAP